MPAFIPAITEYRCHAQLLYREPYVHAQRCPHAVVPGKTLCRSHQEIEVRGGEVDRIPQKESA